MTRRNLSCDSCGEHDGIGFYDTIPPLFSQPWWMCQGCVDVTNEEALKDPQTYAAPDGSPGVLFEKNEDNSWKRPTGEFRSTATGVVFGCTPYNDTQMLCVMQGSGESAVLDDAEFRRLMKPVK